MIHTLIGGLVALSIALPLGGAILALVVRARLAARLAVAVSALQLLTTLVVAFSAFGRTGAEMSRTWLSAIGANLTFSVDGLSSAFSVLVAFVGFAASVYALGHTDPDRVGRVFYAWFLVMEASFLGVIFARDLVLFYLFWELMLIPSTALILGWAEHEKPRFVALKYFTVTHVGAVLLLAGIIGVTVAVGSSNMAFAQESLLKLSPAQNLVIGGLIVAGFAVKLAVVPGHIWLPDAYASAPTPVAIMLSAGMMSTGIYGFMRFASGVISPETLQVLGLPLMAFGVLNQWYGGIMALRQTDIRKIAAFSSVSQVGYVVFGIGTVSVLGFRGALGQTVAHALGKALLFMCTGSVISAFGSKRITEIRGAGKKMPLTMACAVVAALTLSGAPPFAAFQSEWRIFASGMESSRIVLTLLSIGAGVITALYCLNLVYRVFYGEEKSMAQVTGDAPAFALMPMILLSLASLAIGLLPSLATRFGGVSWLLTVR